MLMQPLVFGIRYISITNQFVVYISICLCFMLCNGMLLCVWANESAVYNIEEKTGKCPETSFRINISAAVTSNG